MQALILLCIALAITGLITIYLRKSKDAEMTELTFEQLDALLDDTCSGKQDDTSTIETIKDNIDVLFPENKHYQVFYLLHDKFCDNQCNGFSETNKQSFTTLLDEKLNDMFKDETDDKWMSLGFSDGKTMSTKLIKDILKCIDGGCGEKNQECCNINSALFDEQCGCIDGWNGACNNGICEVPYMRKECEAPALGNHASSCNYDMNVMKKPSCTNHRECDPAYGITCLMGECSNSWKCNPIGISCKADVDCNGSAGRSNNYECGRDKKCKSKGLPFGSKCGGFDECAKPLYCNGGKCDHHGKGWEDACLAWECDERFSCRKYPKYGGNTYHCI